MKISEIIEKLIELSEKYHVVINISTKFECGGIWLVLEYAQNRKVIKKMHYIPGGMYRVSNYKNWGTAEEVEHEFEKCIKELSGKETI